jgi:hypothetical protein
VLGALSPRENSLMKCPRCFAMCAPSDPGCPTCGAPFGGTGGGGGGSISGLTRVLSVIGIAIGTVAGPALMANPKSPPKRGIDINKIVYGGTGAMVCGTLGLVMGMALSGSRRDED